MGKKRMERRRMGRSTSIVLEGKVVKAVEMCVIIVLLGKKSVDKEKEEEDYKETRGERDQTRPERPEATRGK